MAWHTSAKDSRTGYDCSRSYRRRREGGKRQEILITNVSRPPTAPVDGRDRMLLRRKHWGQRGKDRLSPQTKKREPPQRLPFLRLFPGARWIGGCPPLCPARPCMRGPRLFPRPPHPGPKRSFRPGRYRPTNGRNTGMPICTTCCSMTVVPSSFVTSTRTVYRPARA